MTPRADALQFAKSACLYAELKRRVGAAGLIDRAYAYYFCLALACYGLLAIGVASAFWLPDGPGWLVLVAGLIALPTVQIGLLGHDAGHLAICRGVRGNRVIGQFCWSLSLGVGFSYWNNRHTRHHARTNDAADDPDLAGAGLLAYREEEATTRRGWRRVVVRHQAFVAAACMPLLALGFRAEGWAFAARRIGGRLRWLELSLLAVGTGLWLAPSVALGSRWVVIFILSQLMAGVYMSFIIAPNHWGMPVWPHDAPLPFLQRHVLSSRDMTSRPLWDFVFGGLNYQIEHHLFPTMPRAHFRRARAIVRQFCLDNDLPYVEVDPITALAEGFREAHRVGRCPE